MNINELMIKDEKELTVKQVTFLEVHTNIMTSGSVIGNALINLSQNLKRMKEEELYLEAGYSSFEEYSEQACGLKRSQAYNYIKILDNFGEEFVHLNGKIGITKLTLLTTLSKENQTEILQNLDIESASVNDLKNEISKLKEENNKKETVNRESASMINQLQLKIKELEDKPVEVITEIKEDEKSKEKIKELKDKLKNMTEQYEAAKEQYKISSGQAAELRKQISINSDTVMVEFKFKFEALQNLINEIQQLVNDVPEDKKEGCRQALQKVGEMLC